MGNLKLCVISNKIYKSTIVVHNTSKCCKWLPPLDSLESFIIPTFNITLKVLQP